MFGDAVPGSSTRSAYLGTPVSTSEINDYLTPSTYSLVEPAPSETLLSAVHQQNQDKRLEQVVPRSKSNHVTMLSLSFSVPRGVNANNQMRQSYLFFILEEYQCHRVDKFFKPPPISMRDFLTAQIKRSRIMGFMYLGAKIFETFRKKPEKVAIRSCSEWVARHANRVTNPEEPTNPDPSAQDVHDTLAGLLELTIAQFIVSGTAAGYNTLRLALPKFLHLVSYDPNLWIEQGSNGLLCTSLPAVLSSDLVQTRRFVYHDIMYSFILGLPTLAEYDSTGFPTVHGANIPFEWVHGVHGVPIEMIVNIAEIDNWRAQKKRMDWRALETRALEWRWRQREIHSEESVEMVFRAAIQESWRHATLIYIYMGICGVTSHDPRVQTSVHQIVKLMRVVGDNHMDVHFSIPSVVAGLAAQHEGQRTLILRKLKTFNGLRVWILRGQDFARVLQYLWSGPGANGAAIGWDDYVQARCKVLPIW
ncbi:hypothetical protein OPQ81_010433 [Rhizoctonia solani]|nr:hypothetical protein OPQ81_010433 [Rhizoctonia solani]